MNIARVCVFILNVLGDEAFRIRLLEDKHREEVAALKKKLQWFAENQELLDKDAARLKSATAEIHQLQEQARPPSPHTCTCSLSSVSSVASRGHTF